MIYVLITPARNEEAFIEKTLQSVVSQTILPEKWVIVSDGSTDRTDDIVSHYAARHDWIELIRMPEHNVHSFAAKIRCFNAGYQRFKRIKYDIIGNLDADISFGPDYFEFLLSKFLQFPELGVVGTPYIEGSFDVSKSRYYDENCVHGMCQLFRKECFKKIGGFMPVESGGEDTIAIIMARMKGWQTRTFKERKFFHHRRVSSAFNAILSARFHYGLRDFVIGNHPLWELLRGLYQMTLKPYVLGGVLLIFGYLWAFMRRGKRPVSPDFVQFYRKEQMIRLKALIMRIWR